MIKGYKNKMIMSKEIKKVSIYDPSVGAFREFTEDEAKKMINSAKEAEKKLSDRLEEDKKEKENE